MKKMDRRLFVKTGLTAGLAAMGSGSVLTNLGGLAKSTALAAEPFDLAVVKGLDYFKSTYKAVEQLGGISKFVPRHSKVGLLVNWTQKNQGAYVNPDIALAVIKMCFDAGAKEIVRIKGEFRGYFKRSKRFNQFQDEIKNLRMGRKKTVKLSIPQSVWLKKATVRKELLECDVFINMAISKDHEGTKYTGLMKNMMGASTLKNNFYMHYGRKKGLGWFSDVKFLSQCIADLNQVRKPDLCVLDSTVFLATNGPSGPGKLLRPHKVVAGTDSVLADEYSCSLLNLNPEKIEMITSGWAHNKKAKRLKNANVIELEI